MYKMYIYVYIYNSGFCTDLCYHIPIDFLSTNQSDKVHCSHHIHNEQHVMSSFSAKMTEANIKPFSPAPPFIKKSAHIKHIFTNWPYNSETIPLKTAEEGSISHFIINCDEPFNNAMTTTRYTSLIRQILFQKLCLHVWTYVLWLKHNFFFNGLSRKSYILKGVSDFLLQHDVKQHDSWPPNTKREIWTLYWWVRHNAVLSKPHIYALTDNSQSWLHIVQAFHQAFSDGPFNKCSQNSFFFPFF